ncbi:NAD(+) synthase [Methanolapillus ohkumae]|uniref:NH(3)-dependent NAD(+) synthetase n=1 Tax=Methanolapillus ohkumae TaxID=3028298 RepID=A0AA96V752_9EURY|nr:NH(3)-dependent NAD(+) synthetase [Methanosarcinaceae archaeon Am2]
MNSLSSAHREIKKRFSPASAEYQIVSFIQKTVRKAGAKGVVLGLSGGIDSAVVSALCAQALGKENVYCFFFHTGNTYQSDLNDALLLEKQFGFHFQKIDMGPIFVSAKSVLSETDSQNPKNAAEEWTNERRDKRVDEQADKIADERANEMPGKNSIADGNLKSRLRMSLLYNFANQNNLLVIGTKNKTEKLTGYFTKYGDGGVDFEPISDLYKTEIRRLAKHLKLPESVLTKIPSAGFFEGQSDEADLGLSYEELDALLYLMETGRSKDWILKKSGLPKEVAASVLKRMDSAKHKQKMPPGLKLKR